MTSRVSRAQPPRPCRRRPAAALVVVLALLGAGCTASDDAPLSGPTTTATTTADATTTSSADDGPPGSLIDVTPVAEVDGFDSVSTIRYRSESVRGESIEVTGVVAVPGGEAPAGGFPIMTWAHGTTGIADECAPSRDPALALAGLTAWTDAGFVVVATDYEGLGTPGVHPYLLSESEGRSVLDAARAATDLGIEVSGDIVVAGVSQGGHAALAAAELAESWTPELRLVGTVAMAPAGDLETLSTAIFSSPFAVGFGLLVAAGWADAYDDLALADVLTPDGVALAGAVAESGCVAEAFATALARPAGSLFAAEPNELPVWAARIAENSIQAGEVAGPVLLNHGEQDEVIPFALSEVLDEEFCAAGVPTQFVPYPGATHGGVFVESMDESVTWALARIAGEPAPTTCS